MLLAIEQGDMVAIPSYQVTFSDIGGYGASRRKPPESRNPFLSGHFLRLQKLAQLSSMELDSRNPFLSGHFLRPNNCWHVGMS